MERAEIRTRVATFKANQQRFQRKREEYYATTMAKARATPWTSAEAVIAQTGAAATAGKAVVVIKYVVDNDL